MVKVICLCFQVLKMVSFVSIFSECACAVHQISSCRKEDKNKEIDWMEYLQQPQNMTSQGRQHKHQLHWRRLQLIAIHSLCSYSNQFCICIENKQQRHVLAFNSKLEYQEKENIGKNKSNFLFLFLLLFRGLITPSFGNYLAVFKNHTIPQIS